MKRLVSPTLLILIISSFAIGWRADADGIYSPRSMTLAGNQLLVSDRYSGLHIYDVSNLSAPTRVLQIPLRGNVSSAVKDDVVYTNQYSQLQVIRVTGDSYEVLAKLGDELPPLPPPWEGSPGGSGYGCSACNDYDAVTSPTPTSSGGSSFATFAVVDNELYRVNESTLYAYDVTNAEKPAFQSKTPVDWNIETLFPAGDFLFIGGNRGMYIYDRTDPAHPHQLSKIEHTVACDPVVVEGSTAFVTLQSFGACGGFTNELMCVNIADPSKPVIIGEKPMASPYGLAVQNAQLFVSHGSNGYSLVDVSRPDAPVVKATWTDATRDFIWSGSTLFVLEENNVAIYDVTDPMAPVLIARVEPTGSS